MILSRASRQAAILALCALAAKALAQADYSEDFEDNGPIENGEWGPQNLIDKGWIFRNQSDPTNGPAFYDGDGFSGQPLEGEGYLMANSLATDHIGGALSVWAVLPPIPGQQAGDMLSLWILGGGAESDTYFEVRYSPTGATGTGSDEDDIGDFTEVIFAAELPYGQNGYRQILESLPGGGRIALRYQSPWISTLIGSAFLSLDSLAIGDEPPPPCGVPLPEPGETVAWTLADSPYTVCSDLLVPAGGTVLVEPGVTVTFEPECSVRVNGEIAAHGTFDAPIIFDGHQAIGTGLIVAGLADLSHVELSTVLTGTLDVSVLQLRDSVVTAGARVRGGPDVAVIERCEFRGGVLGALEGSLRITDCDFTQGGYADLQGVLFLDNVSIDGAPLLIEGESIAAPNYLDNVSIMNHGAGPGATADGVNVMLGPSFVTQGNLYPFALGSFGGGLLEGSRLPASGNTFDAVLAEELVLGANQYYWADTGVPYLVGGFPANFGGSLTIEPGTTVRMRPGAGAFIVADALLLVEGTPELPITFEAANPGQPWFGLKWVDSFLARQRNVIYSGAELALQSDGGELLLDHCTISDNITGAASVTFGIIHLRASEVLRNGVGMTTTGSGHIDAFGAVGPNIFAENGLAVDYRNIDDFPLFQHNWWNHPTGPTTDQNPDGQGDPVQGLHASSFVPFLESPPAQDDDPPVVDLEPIYYMVHSRDKIILRWDASDDSAIVSQRVEFADHAFPDEYEPIATIGPDQRSFEFTAPVVEPNNLYTTPSGIRVVALDDAGQEWYDEAIIRIPYQEDFTPIHREVQNVPDLVHPHDVLEICWEPGGVGDFYTAVDDMVLTEYHGGTTTGCFPFGVTMPFVSTDTARFLVFTTHGAGGRVVYSFSDYFSIRPAALYGDAPPEVALTSPAGGEQFRGGDVIPVRWTAADDESVRSIAIQATYDGGISWHFVEDELDPSISAFDWELPASGGIEQVTLRVLATDLRFQSASDTSGAFEILPGGPGDCPADFNSDGTVNTQDVLAFLNAWASGDSAGDFNGDGVIDTRDVLAFLNTWSQGC